MFVEFFFVSHDSTLKCIFSDLVPTKEFELARRRLENGITEYWRYASSHLKKLAELKDAAETQKLANQMQEFLMEHKRCGKCRIDFSLQLTEFCWQGNPEGFC